MTILQLEEFPSQFPTDLRVDDVVFGFVFCVHPVKRSFGVDGKRRKRKKGLSEEEGEGKRDT